ncbi:MAG: UDP-N-acetylmuramoyl-tripeptide--D-alanyl-D-alanine ligase [Pseudonocardiales bacterium]|nr:UDP-N-acetylmuramoyl-tripeptide--D-alanyl-D-alanine ligase [Pseudonocardiales bacterium]
MIALSVAEIAAIVAGEVVGVDPQSVVTGKVEFDSRRVHPGDLFLAIVGEHADGHRFAADALAAGAVAVMSTREIETGSIVVADPIAAITALARAVARRLSATIVAVTGSSGKTSTKDLLAQILSRKGSTVAPPGSFNNELGHPYTVLLADESTEFLILEASARGIGHIAHLVQIAPPRIGAVLNVGSAHLGEFGSVAAIAQAKGELVEGLPSAIDGGVAVLNADDPTVMAMAARTAARVVTAGESSAADVRAAQIELDEGGRARFTLVAPSGSAQVELRVVGEHQVSNAVIAAAVALECGLGVGEVAAGLSQAVARSSWRMEVTELGDGITLVNDAYNANPESMRAALKSLAIMSRGRRSIAVLGHMAELGRDSTAEHDALGRLAVRYDISQVIAVGEPARPIAHGAALEGSWNGESEWVDDVAAAIERVTQLIEPGDVVLVKGSRSAGMERVAQALIEQHEGTAQAVPGV